MSIEDVARELYALAPEEFTAARNARAKQAKQDGDPELAARVQSLRKPTAGAWLLNELVRRHGDEVQQVLALGAQLRAAQGTLGADELRALDRQRRQLTHAVAQQARALGRDAGRRVTDQTTAEVEETLRSAMVDEAAGAALVTGLLTDTFSSTGIEPVDLSRVIALAEARAEPGVAASARTPATAGDEVPDPALQQRVAEAELAVAEAGSTARAAHDRAEQARELVTRAQQLHEQLESEREEVRARLHDLDAQVASAAKAHDTATRDLERAQQAEVSAAEAAEGAAAELEAVRESAR